MFYDIVLHHHEVVHRGTKDLKVAATPGMQRVGYFRYTINSQNSKTYLYIVKFNMMAGFQWEAEICETNDNSQPFSLDSFGKNKISKYTYKKCNIINRPPALSYPVAAKRAGITGTVILDLVVQKDGKVGSITVLEGPSELVDSAKDYANQLIFSPTTLNNDPIVDEFRLIIPFKLKY